MMTTSHSNGAATTAQSQGYRDRPSPLAMTTEAYHRAALLAAEIAAEFYASRGQRPVYSPLSSEGLASLRGLAVTERGIPEEEVLAFFAASVMPYDMGNQAIGFAAWVHPAAAPVSYPLDYL